MTIRGRQEFVEPWLRKRNEMKDHVSRSARPFRYSVFLVATLSLLVSGGPVYGDWYWYAYQYDGNYYQDVVSSMSPMPGDVGGSAAFAGPYLTCRVEVWVNGGQQGEVTDEQDCTLGAYAERLDWGYFCGGVVSVANALGQIWPFPWATVKSQNEQSVYVACY